MSTTLTYSDGWSVSRQQYRVGADQTILEYATNMAVSEMWKLYDWRGTVLPLNPFWIVPGEQDYGKPLYSVPTDFWGIRECYLVEAASNNQYRQELKVVKNLQRTGYLDFPDAICYRDSISGFRIWPCPQYGMSAPYYLIDGTYKTRPPHITRATMTSLLPWDDVYFNTFCQALAWAALVASGDRDEAMKQYAIFRQSLQTDSSTENLELGEDVAHPSEALQIFGRPTWWAGLPALVAGAVTALHAFTPHLTGILG